MDKVVLAYSGGLDTSVMVKWIAEKYNAEVVTVTVDVGQKEDLAAIEAKAKMIGASKHYTIDAKREFVERFIFPAIKANGLYQGKYPLSTALARPLIAEKLVEVARKEKAKSVAHGCTGRGNDQVRFEVTVATLAPELILLAPVREWRLTREEEISYAEKHGIPITIKTHPYSTDQNLWGRSVECGPLDDPEKEPPSDVYEWTTHPEAAPNAAEYVTVAFERGIPVSLNNVKLDGLTLIKIMHDVACRHGVGRIDHIEDRVVGLKSREVYECPSATCLIEAHKDLEKFTLTRHELMFKQYVDAEWSWLVYSGLWSDPLRMDLDSFIDRSQEKVSGEVKFKLFKGNATVVGRSSPSSPYFAKADYDQSIARGFIELWGLPSRTVKATRESGSS